jgi:hypothetical protein
MATYLRNRWLKVGLTLVVLGWDPLLGTVLLSSLGLWPDPNPNPIGPGLLFFVTSWPVRQDLGSGHGLLTVPKSVWIVVISAGFTR